MPDQIQLSLDGDQWCALWGDDLQTGISGFGYTLVGALKDLITNMEELGHG